MVVFMLINNANLQKGELNSFAHKVRAVVFDEEGKLYITDMNSSFNLPGGRVENSEELIDSLTRELKEELGIDITFKDVEYIGNFVFWHKNFPGEKGLVNRENKVDLFWIIKPQKLIAEEINLTNYEKHYNFKLRLINIAEIKKLIKVKNTNEYKIFTDVELEILIKAYLKYRKEGILC